MAASLGVGVVYYGTSARPCHLIRRDAWGNWVQFAPRLARSKAVGLSVSKFPCMTCEAARRKGF